MHDVCTERSKKPKFGGIGVHELDRDRNLTDCSGFS
jgi:hypothetical protein